MALRIFSTLFQSGNHGSERRSRSGKSIACHRLQVRRSLGIPAVGAPAVGGLFLLGVLLVPGLGGAQFVQIDLAVDVKSRFSDGCSSVQELQTLAQHRGLDGLIFGDHDQKSLEYGIWPFERILKKKDQHPSLLASGAATFISEIRRLNDADADQVLIPAVESAPFYYWTGRLFENNLTAHDWGKHLLIVGLPSAVDYEQLPILNSNFSTEYSQRFLLPFVIFCALFLLGTFCFYKKWRPKTSLLWMVLMALLAANNHPLRSSPFDPYHGSQGVKPYQELIDYAVSRGALVFWNHLETATAMGRGGESMKLETPPHAQDLLATRNYTGFQMLHDSPVTAADPGREWDQVLNEYLAGKRSQPVWGYGANDFHCEGQDGHKLGGVRTIVVVRQKDEPAVIQAMREGRMYAVRQADASNRLALDSFALSDPATGQRALWAGQLVSQGFPQLNAEIRATGGLTRPVNISIIRNGREVQRETVTLPYHLQWRDTTVDRSAPAYYRLIIDAGESDRLLTNPIFVRFDASAPQVASAPETPDPPPAKTAMEKAIAALEKKMKPEAKPLSQPATLPESATHLEPKPEPEPIAAPQQKYVEARIEGLALRQGPGVKFPKVGQVGKGERLLMVERTQVEFQNKAWLKVQTGELTGYVWEGFVRAMPGG